MTQNPRQIRAAFTLVELLVVLGIIVVLAAMLLPALARAHEKGIRAHCLNNLHQLGLALHMYVDDSRYYPGHYILATPIESSRVVWPGRIFPYTVNNRKLFMCPNANKKAEWSTTANVAGQFPFNLTGTNAFSYGYNDWGGGRMDTKPYAGLGAQVNVQGEISSSSIKCPSDMIAITDSNCDGQWDTATDPVSNAPNQFPGDRHNEGANVLFCDGHVEYFKTARLIEETDNMRMRWNSDHQPHPENW
jgi:prepilin-type processing-associated H-X9-DG protein/prepilin-type N-terminal cleavage/methylation domain-containing protein